MVDGPFKTPRVVKEPSLVRIAGFTARWTTEDR